MSNWNEGYVSEIGYTYGYYTELNPLRINLAFLNAGLRIPKVGTACELGFGQGLSTCVHAAASTVSWFGTDFNPAQARFAQDLSDAAGVSTGLYDDSFAEFCSRTDLPDFDYIALHGIWSWISDDNRAIIVDFIKRKLKTGGVLYISYNTLPGWSTAAPLRHLMTNYTDSMSAEGEGIVKRIDAALEFADKLIATNPLYAKANPQVKPRFDKLKEQNRHYLAHEYFNHDWHPMYFSDMAKWLAPAKLNFACSANYLDFVGEINLTNEQASILDGINDPVFRQTTRDFIVNQQFRKDYWIKGPITLSGIENRELRIKQRIVLGSNPADIELKVQGVLGQANLTEAIYRPILDTLADFKPKTLAQIEQAVQPHNIGPAQVFQVINVLMGMGHLMTAQSDADIAKAKPHTDKLNHSVMLKSRTGGEIAYLASPVTGGGIAVDRIQQLFLLAEVHEKKKRAEIVPFVWQILSSQGQTFRKEGKPLEGAEANMAELEALFNKFTDKQLPILKALQVI